MKRTGKPHSPAYTIPNLFYLRCNRMSRTNPGNRKEIMKTVGGFPLTRIFPCAKIGATRMWGAMGAPPVAGGATRASGRGRQMTKPRCRQGSCRAPQQENIFAPTPRMKPSACVNLGPISFIRFYIITDFFFVLSGCDAKFLTKQLDIV